MKISFCLDPIYVGSRFKDEVTDYYYGNGPHRFERENSSSNCGDEVLPAGSARSLSSSASLALQTLERAQQNRDKFWDDRSPKKSSTNKF